MNHDLALISAVLEEKDFSKSISAGMSPDLLGDEALVYWDVLSSHWELHHEVPSVDFFKGLCPTYEHQPAGVAVEAIIGQLKMQKLGTEIDQAVRDVADVNSVDPWTAKKRLIDAA